MGSACSTSSSVTMNVYTDSELKTLRMKFDALAAAHSEDGYILKEDFLRLFRIPGLLGERLFAMFDANSDNKLFWPDFIKGIEQCMFSNDSELDDFIYRFFCLDGRCGIEFEEFQSILQHLPPSVLFVVVKSAENRSSVAQKWVEQFGNQLNELPQEAVQTGIGLLLEAYFQSNDDDVTRISFHAFSVFLSEQPGLRDYFKSIFKAVGLSVTPIQTPTSSTSQTFSVTSDYQAIPFDSIDPEVYRSRNTRSLARLGHREKWSGFTRAYWCIACNYCHKEVRFCCICQGELKPIEKNDGLRHLQCTECQRVISMRYCSACGHQFEETVVDARMEIPGINAEVKELSGELFQLSHFNSMSKVFARIHNNFLYLFANRYSEIPVHVFYLEKVVVKKMTDEKNAKHYGFCLQFPSSSEKHFYCQTESERETWMQTIEDASGVRKIEDYYDIREKIGEGRFATVFRCVDKSSLKEYAVKVVNKSHLTDKERELIQTEIAILSLVQHKRIVALIETFDTNECLYIVMELLRGGELYQNICGRSVLSEEEAYKIIVPLAECLSYMHSMGIIHRDIKPENILCDKNLYDVKIGDFGFSKLIFPKEKLDYPCGTLNYIAPEVITRQGYTTKADMWSLGIIFYLLLRGRLPFDGKSKDEVFNQIIRGSPDYNNKSIMRLSPKCKDMIKGLLQKNPDLRLSADDVLHHPWVLEMKAKMGEHHDANHLDLNSEKIYPDISDKKAGYEGLKSNHSEEIDWVRPESHTVEKEIKESAENKESATQEAQESDGPCTMSTPPEKDCTSFVVSEKAVDKQEIQKDLPPESGNHVGNEKESPTEDTKTENTIIPQETENVPATGTEVPVETNKENVSDGPPETAETFDTCTHAENNKIDNSQFSPENGDPPIHEQIQEKPVDAVL